MKVLFLTPYHSSSPEGSFARFHDLLWALDGEGINYDVLSVNEKSVAKSKPVRAINYIKDLAVKVKDYDIIHSIKGRVLHIMLSRVYRKPLVIGPNFTPQYIPDDFMHEDLEEKWEKSARNVSISPVALNGEVVITQSKFHGKILEKEWNVSSISLDCGVRTDIFSENGEEVEFEENTLMYVGNKSRLKGLHLLLSIPNLTGDYNIVVVGCNVKGLDSYGRIPREELGKFYRGADVTIAPSYWETNQMVTIESLACGTPVIASDIPSQRELDNGNMLFFERGNPKELAETLEKFEGEKRYWRENALKNSDLYGMEEPVEKMKKIYKDVSEMAI